MHCKVSVTQAKSTDRGSTTKPSLSLRDFLLELDHGKYGRSSRFSWLMKNAASDETGEAATAGALRQIEEPVAEVSAISEFLVVGDWSDWDFEPLQRSEGSEKCEEFVLEVKLPHAGGEFQIVCDRDWSRVLYPGPGSPGKEVLGPDSDGHGRNWCLNGRRGDIFLLRLLPGQSGHPGPMVSWDLVEAGPLEEHGISYSSIAEGAGWQEAVERVEEMKRHGEDCRAERSQALRLCGEAGASAPALQLLEDIWSEDKQANEPSQEDYQSVLRACELSGDQAEAAVRQEMAERGEEQEDRFCLTPRVYWHRDVRRMGCGASNTLDWQGGDPPEPPTSSSWLLPASDNMAVEIARQQEALREAGWRILSCDPDVVRRLDDKVELQALAEGAGLSSYFPKRFRLPERASYPCILKPAAGEFGAGVQIVYSAESVRRITGTDSGELTGRWLLQELVVGCHEFSTSLLVLNGKILEKACIRYRYDAEEYVWPQVTELEKELVEPTESELKVMEKLVQGYSGFVNFNYKVRRTDEQMLIMEANARVGADLACDVPRPLARRMLELLDRVYEDGPKAERQTSLSPVA